MPGFKGASRTSVRASGPLEQEAHVYIELSQRRAANQGSRADGLPRKRRAVPPLTAIDVGDALTTCTALPANQESPMAKTKTKPTGASVDAYLASRASPEQLADCKAPNRVPCDS